MYLIPLAALSAAIAACVVAWVQASIAKQSAERSLRFGLYKLRLGIYDACQRMLDACTTHMDRTDEESEKAMRETVREFLRNTAEATFLFPPPMREYINGIRVLAMDLRGIARQRQTAQQTRDTDKQRMLMDADGKLVEKLMTYDHGMRDRFAPFLDFSDD